MKYRTIVADPPWPMKWSGGASTRVNGRGERHGNARATVKALPYPVMSIDEIAALPIHGLAEPDAHLYLWITDGFLLDGVARRVVEAWGFTRPRLLVWHKTGFGLGTFPRPQHEVCIVAVRGSAPFRARNVGSVQTWPLVYEPAGLSHGRKHSAKPPAFHDLVEQVSPGPYLELFARSQRLGWDTWGNEALEHVIMSRGPGADTDEDSA